MASSTEDLGALDSWEVADLEESMNRLNLEPKMVQDYVQMQMQMQEIQDNIRSKRNKIFLLMEEQRIRSMRKVVTEVGEEETNERTDIPSSFSFLPHVKLMVTVSGAMV
ncbi:hypothetical protein RJT34_19999 [Clitoria ternatea]|uniref:Uncharacterized protein n=1 Tax=Clitoria ternatea TaxID=43366 RepID=A0AAN9IS26_CLITE